MKKASWIGGTIMRRKLKYILIFAFGVLLIGCKFGKTVPSPENQINNEQSEAKPDESDEKELGEKSSNEPSKNSDGNKEEKSQAESKENNNEASSEKSSQNVTEKSDEKATSESREIVEEDKTVATNKKKIIYLTFDDGPSFTVTSNVLDILKENKVKATFF